MYISYSEEHDRNLEFDYQIIFDMLVNKKSLCTQIEIDFYMLVKVTEI